MTGNVISQLLFVSVALFGLIESAKLITPLAICITNVSEYEEFMSDPSRDRTTIYIIKSGAVPNVFHHVRAIATIDVPNIIVNDDHNNYVSLQMSQKYVSAFLTQGGIGAGQLQLLPSDYITYNVYAEALSMADMNTIEQWHSAESIDIYVDVRPSDEVLARGNKLSSTRIMVSRFAKATADVKTF